eukprot:UN22281
MFLHRFYICNFQFFCRLREILFQVKGSPISQMLTTHQSDQSFSFMQHDT